MNAAAGDDRPELLDAVGADAEAAGAGPGDGRALDAVARKEIADPPGLGDKSVSVLFVRSRPAECGQG
jgi:hypothetical protein